MGYKFGFAVLIVYIVTILCLIPSHTEKTRRDQNACLEKGGHVVPSNMWQRSVQCDR